MGTKNLYVVCLVILLMGCSSVAPGTRYNPLETPTDVAEPPSHASRTDSGLAYRILRKGDGTAHPNVNSRVTVHYSGWTTDGKMFDSSHRRGATATFPLSGVIRGWVEGVQLMVVGDLMRFWIPAKLAYGDPPRRPGAPGGMLVFDIELVSFQ